MASKALIAKKPREQAGSVASRAFDFQMHASMARILDAYQNGEACWKRSAADLTAIQR